MGGLPPELVTALGALGPTVWAEAKDQARRLRINRGWKGPFALSFDDRLTYDIRRVIDEGNRRGRFCHVLVHNSSSVDLQGCIGELRAISKRTPDGRYVLVSEYRRPLQLRWANVGSFARVPIEGNEMARLDLCYTVEGRKEFRLEVPDGLGVQTTYGPGIYRVTIRVSAPRAKTTVESFLIVHDGRWGSIKVKHDPSGRGDELLTAEEITRVADAVAPDMPEEEVGTSSSSQSMIMVPGQKTQGTTDIRSRGVLDSNSTQSIVIPQRDSEKRQD